MPPEIERRRTKVIDKQSQLHRGKVQGFLNCALPPTLPRCGAIKASAVKPVISSRPSTTGSLKGSTCLFSKRPRHSSLICNEPSLHKLRVLLDGVVRVWRVARYEYCPTARLTAIFSSGIITPIA